MPGKPFQSKLEPFLELIRQWRCQRWSYPRIAEALRNEHGMTVAPSTVFSFVKVRATNRKVFALPSSGSVSTNRQLSSSSPTPEAKQRSKSFFDQSTDSNYEPRKYNLNKS
jgi:IS30 family transposase